MLEGHDCRIRITRPTTSPFIASFQFDPGFFLRSNTLHSYIGERMPDWNVIEGAVPGSRILAPSVLLSVNSYWTNQA